MHWLSDLVRQADDVTSPLYGALSGWVGDLGVAAIPVTLLRKHNCHSRGCLRIGRFPHPYNAFMFCRRHHPQDV